MRTIWTFETKTKIREPGDEARYRAGMIRAGVCPDCFADLDHGRCPSCGPIPWADRMARDEEGAR